MRKLNFNFLTGLFTLCSLYVTAQQTYVNKDWEYIGGIPGQYDYVQSKLHSNGNLILVGNNSTNGQTDILITALSIDGTVAWQQTNSGANGQNDYGTDLAIDNTGNIFVCGAVHNGSNTDYRILKYSPDGTLIWTKQYNGTGNGDDVPVAIRIDASNNIYVTGTSTGSGTLTDFATLKYDQSGTLIWTKRYNYSNLPEIATCLEIDNSGNVFVAGASANNLNNSDFCVVKYNSSGTQMAVQRHSTTGNGYDLPSEMTLNSNGNVFIVGTSEAGNNKNVKLLALTNSLTVLWSQYIDQFGRDDEGYSITLTPTNNLVITGYSKKQSGGTNLIVAKYSLTGSQIWLKNKTALIDNEIAKGRKVRVNSSGKIFVSGESFTNNTRDLVTQSYDDNGNLLWEKTYDNSNTTEKAAQLIVSNEDVYVTGTTNVGSTDKLATVKYSAIDKPFSIAGSGDTLWNAHQLIIRFDTSAIFKAAVDKTDLEAGAITEFVKTSVLTDLSNKTGFNWYKMTAYKVFRKLTTNDTISITRLGDTIKMPPFWATLSVFIPEGYDEQAIADSITTLPSVCYADRNFLSCYPHQLPNDTYIGTQQESLVPTTTYPNANINIEPAWDFETGKDYIKVGVFDYPVYWSHEDFGDGTYSGSKIKGGWDYGTHAHISTVTNPVNSHGTACAGIIGALRNNQKGIAGIAGGDMQNGNTGVQLYSFGIFKDASTPYVGDDYTIEAIVWGATWNPSSPTHPGYGLHVQNHSWGGAVPYSYSFYKAVSFCWANSCAFVASRGNGGTSDLNYPACYRDNAVLNTGASGTDGKHLVASVNGDVLNTSFGGNVDFIAPGTIHVVSAPINPSAPFTSWTNELNDPLYSTFRGTSAAAPHVSGVAALMFSYYNTNNGCNNNLAPEDVEFILQKYAKDKFPVGYDDHNGWGLIDAGNAIAHINYPEYQIIHSTSYTHGTSEIIANNITIGVAESMNGVLPGYYIAKLFRITRVYDIYLSSNYSIQDIWPIVGLCNGVSNSTDVKGEPYMSFTINSLNQNTAVVTVITYCWKIISYPNGTLYTAWVPEYHSSIETPISIHVKDLNLSSEIVDYDNYIEMFPNPANEELSIIYKYLDLKSVRIEIYDVTGRKMKDVNTESNNIYALDISSLKSGLYYCKFT